MATQLGQFNANTYILSTDSNGVIADLKFKSANQNTVTAGYDGSKVTFKNGDTSLSVEAALSAEVALSAETCTGNAATATKLATANNITITNNNNKGNAANFDGSNSISIELPTDLSVNNLTASSINGTAIASSIGNAADVAASQQLATDISSAVQQIIGQITKIKYRNCLKFTAAGSDATIAMKKHGNAPAINLMTSIDDGITWQDFIVDETVISLNQNDSVLFKAGMSGNISFGSSIADYNNFVMTGDNVKATGNIMSLIDGENFDSSTNLIISSFAFSKIFQGCTSLTTAPVLPATTLADNCYSYMFSNCTSLTSTPALPATTLAFSCYYCMFDGCISLTSASALPATQLAINCYSGMFSGCTNLTQAPALPATQLAINCYSNMFHYCTSLTSTPALPATQLASDCYSHMFSGCTSTVAAPALPATTLAFDCYSGMFQGCTNLTQAPALPATQLANNCYENMFADCTNLTQAPALPATTLADNCYNYMFYGCSKLNSIEVAFISWNTNCTEDWVNGTTSLGTFTCPTSLLEQRGTSYIPENWTIVRKQ